MNKTFISILEFFAVLSVMFMAISFLSHILMRKISLYNWFLAAQNKGRFLGNFFAAFTGAITPFCVCTTIPVFTGLLFAGISTHTAMSFLFASPLINISSVVLMFFLFGAKFSFYFIIMVLSFSILGGILVYYLKLDSEINPSFKEAPSSARNMNASLYKEAANSSLSLFRNLFLSLVTGAIIAGIIHNYVPVRMIEYFNKFPVFIVIPLVALIGFPLYLNILVLTPVCYSLLNKGANPAVIMTLMLSGAGISLPTAVVIAKILKKNLFIYYLVYTFLAYCIIGFVFNFLK